MNRYAFSCGSFSLKSCIPEGVKTSCEYEKPALFLIFILYHLQKLVCFTSQSSCSGQLKRDAEVFVIKQMRTLRNE